MSVPAALDLSQLHTDLCRALEARPGPRKAKALMRAYADTCESLGLKDTAAAWRWSAANYRSLADG